MKKQGKLELTWVGKDERQRLEPRILIEDPTKSYGDPKTDNMLIFGDNLLALKALEQDFAGKIKCIYIDPPYNTGSAFTHYDDGLEHSIWLQLMRDRLELLRNLLSVDGTLWISIDDDESHYLKVLCDEIFGRQNFVANVIWQKKFSPQNDAKWLSDMHDHIILYAKDKPAWRPKRIEFGPNGGRKRTNIDGDERGEWISVDYTCNKNKYERPNLYYPIINPNTVEQIWPKETAVWRYSEETHLENEKLGLVYWGKTGRNKVPRFKNFKAIHVEGQIPTTIWFHQDVGNNQEARKESLQLNSNDPFATPKPERLIQRILHIASNEGDLVLDSFAGSGTTGAVAHKMGRKWIMVELGEHCHTHIIPRMEKVVDGTDQGGISNALEWKGGGGFKYYHLAETLLLKDNDLGVYVINPKYNAETLIRAICKIENFRYRIKGRWHGYSSESRFIHITTKLLNQKYLDMLASELGDEQSLMIYSTKRAHSLRIPDNIEMKRIPKHLLEKCEFNAEVK